MKFWETHQNASFTRRLIVSYGKDWLLVIAMIAVFFAIDIIQPFHREFSINDTSLMHTFAVYESVPTWLLIVIAIVIPIVIILVYCTLIRKNWLDLNSGLLGLGLALSLTIMITDVIKITSGRPRPDMFDRCAPPPDIQNPPLGLLNYTICTKDHNSYVFNDGFKSFPSGHSSLSFAGLSYLSFFLAGKMHLFDKGGHTYKSFIFSFPFLGALLVAISRVHDYRHHWSDVFIGGIIGLLFAYFSYRQYYPSLGSLQCQKPYPPRLTKPRDLFPGDGHCPQDEEQAVIPGDPIYGEYAEESGPSNYEHSSYAGSAARVGEEQKYTTNHVENQSNSNSPPTQVHGDQRH